MLGMPEKSSALMSKIHRGETWLIWVACIYYLIFLIFPTSLVGQRHSEDPMAVSGFGILILAIFGVRRVQAGFAPAVGHLIRRGILIKTGEQAVEERFAGLSVVAISIVVVTLVPLAVYGLVNTDTVEEGKPFLISGGVIGAILIGVRFGVAVATGVFASTLRRSGLRVVLSRNSTDMASGLRPLGDFFFKQGLFVLIPAVVMLFWLIAAERGWSFATIYVCTVGDYLANCEPGEFLWQDQFYRLMAFNILVVFNFAVLVPALFLRALMVDFKNRHYLPAAAYLEDRLQNSRFELYLTPAHSLTVASYLDREREIAALNEEYDSYMGARTWPIPIAETAATVLANASAVYGLLAPMVPVS